ncbi:uncharacterized protein LOC124879945 isoform X2 [Girardinichthys multiradiatus]|uniref:uncharacterized protein LOC124879945 isoform X2 n=1 Tax=Girardinichthys multiradiatus TaxID=208333 RepID=UPI001FAC55A1|nr:uncharacterized protein LOC124879945 isoform X2 [Girardinichthys multiradiatus]
MGQFCYREHPRSSTSPSSSAPRTASRDGYPAVAALSCHVRVTKDDASHAGSRCSVSVSRVAAGGGGGVETDCGIWRESGFCCDLRSVSMRHPGDVKNICRQLHIPLRLLCGGLLFTCNAVMWTFLAKALRLSWAS